jgi:hypothetical protein
MSTFFLPLALVMLARPPAGARRVVLSLLFYALALVSKETAVVGVVLLGAIYLLRKSRGEGWLNKAALIGYAGVTLAYLVVRHIAIGTFVQSNWDLGPHVLRNVAGGVLFQFYPWAPSRLR